ncbi:icd, partial [Symbiodinium microadriaticum]
NATSRDILKKEITEQKVKLQSSRDTLQAKSDGDAKADEIGKLVADAKKKISDFGKFLRDMTAQ